MGLGRSSQALPPHKKGLAGNGVRCGISKDKQDCFAMILAGERPVLDLMSAYSREMQDLIVEAWDEDPRKRPTASDMVKRIENMRSNL